MGIITVAMFSREYYMIMTQSTQNKWEIELQQLFTLCSPPGVIVVAVVFFGFEF